MPPGRNAVVVPASDYKKAQFIAFEVKPGLGQADLIAGGDDSSKSTNTGEYRGPRGKKTILKDLENRCSIMKDAIAAAAKSAAIDKKSTVLKVFMAAVNNLTNRTNFSGFSGIQTSPFFLTPTAAQNPRKVDIGVGLRF